MGDPRHGERITVEGNVGDDQGSVRGLDGRVHGINPTFVKNGVDYTNVKLENGDVVAVPDKAIKRKKR